MQRSNARVLPRLMGMRMELRPERSWQAVSEATLVVERQVVSITMPLASHRMPARQS